MNQPQPGILSELPSHSRYLTFNLGADAEPASIIEALSRLVIEETVVGLGLPLVQTFGVEIPGLKTFAAPACSGIAIPSTQAALWCWLRGDDRGELLHRSRAIEEQCADSFDLVQVTDGFVYGSGRDLSGYEDGTENPQGDQARTVALRDETGPGLAGSSMVAVQQWVHDLDALAAMSGRERDNAIGRRIADNAEMDDAPASAHVKRTAQESFAPEAFVLRRSMPWADGMDSGLMFVAFGASFDSFESLLNRMIGGEDGVTDGIFRFTQPVSGGYYWCPPVSGDRLELAALTSR